MNQALQEKCQLFVENKNVLDKNFVWDSMMIMPVCAMLHAEENRKVDTARMKDCRKLLKGKAGIFSGFRSYGELVLLSKMSMSDNPNGYLEQALQAYDLIKKYKLSESSFTALAAMILVDNVAITEWEAVLRKAQTIYTRMKKNHPFLTSTEDVSFAILMAMSEVPEEQMMQEMEACYKILSKKFASADGAQSLSHVLAMDSKETVMKCEEIFELNRMFKAKNKRFDDRGIVLYGGLNMLDMDKAALLEEMIEVDRYLKLQKGFGFFGIDAQQRLMYATILVMNQYNTTHCNTQVAMMNSAIGMMIAEYTAMFTTIMAANTVMMTTNS